MWLIVGLGNPGDRYLMTRHNIGFMAIDAFLATSERPPWKSEKRAKTFRLQVGESPALLCQPQTYMNRSGGPVADLATFYKVSPEHILVIHDDVDLAFGNLRVQWNRGHGGHNGIRDITHHLGSSEYLRLKLGVGRPENPKMDLANYVLQKFSPEEQVQLPEFLNHSGDAIESLISRGLVHTANQFHDSKQV